MIISEFLSWLCYSCFFNLSCYSFPCVIEVFFFLLLKNNGKLQENKILKFLGFMWNPLSWVMEAAAIMAIALANGGVSTQHSI